MAKTVDHTEIEFLTEDEEFRLHRVRSGDETVIVRSIRPEHPKPSALARLRHVLGLTDRLDPAWALVPLRLDRSTDPPSLILTDAPGQFLDRLLGPPMEVGPFLRVARAIARALEGVHRAGLVHRELRPQHILVDLDTDQARVTGFFRASSAQEEPPPTQPPELIEEALPYTAPELTGRLNRAIDARTDLYALGVCLYQLLTGSLPCVGQNALEWVYCHVARTPMAPLERVGGIPPALSDLVMKLLQKDPEDRYQSAASLGADLEACLQQWEAHGRIDSFPLDRSTAPERFTVPLRLYGRDQALSTLFGVFHEVASGRGPGLVLVSGHPGIGKTSLVLELRLPVARQHGYFLTGKFDQYTRDIPFATLVQAFRELVQQVLAEPEDRLTAWRERLEGALGANGQLIIDAIPQVELLIGTQKPVADLPPSEAQRRFDLAFRQFMGVFATPDHPLVVFLDDLQWADPASLRLIAQIVTHPETRYLLLAGAFRDTEVAAGHPLRQTIHEIREAGGSLMEIALPPLAEEDLNRLVADTLRTEPDRSRSLGTLVFEKTHGNPFFASQFLKTLYRQGLVTFDRARGEWEWDLARIQAENFTDNVVALMVDRLRRLPAATREVLEVAACLGTSGTIASLATAAGKPETETLCDLAPAVQEGLFFHRENLYRFLHDRVQQAAYSLIPPKEIGARHLAIGRRLLAVTAEHQLAQYVFEIVRQLNLGAVHIRSEDERYRLADLNLLAGRRAKTTTAYQSALHFLSAGCSLLPERAWELRYDLAFALFFERAETEFLDGNLGEAERQLDALAAKARTKVDHATVCRLAIDLHVTKGEHTTAIDKAVACMGLFSIPLAAHPTKAQVQQAYDGVWEQLRGRSIDDLIDLPLMTDPEIRAAMRVLAVLFAPAYFCDHLLLQLHICHMVSLSLRYGNTDASAHGYAWFGVILGPYFHRYEEAARFGKLACDLVERHHFVSYRAKAYYSTELIVFWSKPVSIALDYIRTAFRAATESGDLTVACYAADHIVTDLLARGDPLDEVLAEAERALAFARRANYRDVEDIIISQLRFTRAMRGETRDLASFEAADFDQDAFEASLTPNRMAMMVVWYFILKLQAHYLAGDFRGAIAIAEQAEPLLYATICHPQYHPFVVCHALALAAEHDRVDPSTQEAYRHQLEQYRIQLAEWAGTCPETFEPSWLLVRAELSRLSGQDQDAMPAYDSAIRSAHANGFAHLEGIANEVAARYYQGRDLETLAVGHLREAQACFARWGATGKVRQLEAAHTRWLEPLDVGGARAVRSDQLDALALVRASQAISREVTLPSLLETLMRSTLEHSGAERGALILFEPAGDRVAAWAAGDRISLSPSPRPELPEGILNYVRRTHEPVVLEDAFAHGPFSSDPYVRARHARSVLCLPLQLQTAPVGLLYLENNLTSGAFTPRRLAVLEVLSAQAVISLENARLLKNLQKAALVVEHSPTALFILTADHQLDYLSENVARVLGYRPAEVDYPGRIATLLAAEDRPGLVQAWREFIEQEADHFRHEFRITSPDGRPRWIELTTTKERATDGHVGQYLGTMQDITERKEAEEERTRLIEREQTTRADLQAARESDRLKDQFVSAVSHDLRTPLTAIRGYLEFLEEGLGGPLTPEQARYVQQVDRNARRLEFLVSDLLDFARLEAGTFRLTLEEGDFVGRLEAVADTFAPMAKSAGIRLLVDLPSAPLQLPLDAQRIDQVLSNLVSNALRFTSAGGTIAVRAQVEGDWLRCEVADTGEGIAKEDLPQLFHRFSQLESGIRKPGGTGLGLSICKAIIEAHGGEIGVTSELGSGSVFWFTLPRGAGSKRARLESNQRPAA